MNNFFKKITGDNKKGGKKLGGGGSGGSGGWDGGGNMGENNTHNLSNNSNKNKNNPFQQLTLPGQRNNFKGPGQSLGGSKPGVVKEVIFTEVGPLGLKVEKDSSGKAIVAEVVEGGQADKAGLLRGDFLCYHGSNGQDEVMYQQFLSMAKLPDRPLYLEVRRIQVKNKKTAPTSTAAANTEAYTRKQAMIAAAEAREKKAKGGAGGNKAKGNNDKNKNLPSIRNNLERHQLEMERQERLREQELPKTEEARKAMELAKANEAKLAAQLGYNPYETNKLTSGQARNTVTAVTTGTVTDPQPQQSSMVHPPSNPIQPTRTEQQPQTEYSAKKNPIDPEFDEIYSIIITSNKKEDVKSSLNIVKKLINNATTKGQNSQDSNSEKFRRIRLTNEKIKGAIIDIHGAFDLMLLVGFQLIEEGSESYLVFPSDYCGPAWLPKALQQIEQF